MYFFFQNRPQIFPTLKLIRRLPELPEVIWELIGVTYCDMVRLASDHWLQTRLRHLRE